MFVSFQMQYVLQLHGDITIDTEIHFILHVQRY